MMPNQPLIEMSVAPLTKGPTLPGALFRDIVTCTVNPDDGQATGAPISASIIIANSAPVIGSVSIIPAQPVVGDSLTCSEAGTTDIDGDSNFTASYQWSINGIVVHSGAQLSGGFVGGDSVLCSVVVSDGQDTSSAMTSAVSIGHSLPSVSQVMVQPSQPTANDDILCSYSYSDVDGDGTHPLSAGLLMASMQEKACTSQIPAARFNEEIRLAAV